MAKFRYSLNAGTSWTVVDAALPYSIPSTNSQDVLVEPIGAAVLNEKPPVVVTAPSAFTAGQWSIADAASGGTATVTIAALPNNGGSAITAIQYKAGAGAWTNSGIASTGTFNITGLTNGAAVNVLVRAVNAIGNGPDSDTKSVTPTAAPAIPFTYDANTYWWDMDHSGNAQDSVGYNSVSIVRERLRGEVEPWQPIKARQPLKVTGGVNFNQSTNRGLVIELPKITNGKNGWYIAGVVQPEVANGQIMSICRNGGSQMSRMDFLFNGSRQFGFRGNSTDNSTVAYVAQIAAVALNGIYAFEVLWDFDADTAKIWMGGVEQTLSSGPTGGPWDNFPASDPSDVRLGNTAANNLSFSGTMRQLIFQDGVPSSAIRSSISSYNLSRAA
ncbi:MAG: fibronectin type III domain-containing protein [Agrobacterium cavarae]|uniref:fibronectin type III domain-containing protein n=1 Tax=Agrobacterium cavarae TaxID=2528239 RepID=UPI0031A744F3